MSSWRCRRLAVDASIGTGYLKYFWRCSRYLSVQEASSGQLVSGGAGGRLLVSGSRHRIAKKSFTGRSWFHSWFQHSCFHRYLPLLRVPVKAGINECRNQEWNLERIITIAAVLCLQIPHIKTFCQICHVQAMYKPTSLYMPTFCTKSYGS